jgi:ActR/RegA family two-component response regulator
METNFLSWIADFVPEKPRILLVDNDRDFTHSTKLALEKRESIPFAKRTTQAGLTKRHVDLIPT